ncbi:MAG: hypothetical protein ACRDLF_00815 [Solirubrobacteraceae bacterium]
MQVVFLGMALLFGLSFVLLGVGGGFGSGGILSAFTGNEGSSSASFAGKVEAAQKRVKSHPSEAAAWAALTEAQLHQASEPEFIGVVGEREQFTGKGLALLAKVSSAWNTYLRLEPHHANAVLAQTVASIYSEQGLNKPAEETRTLQVAIAGKPPSAGLYSSLAESAYKARNLSVGDTALRKAVALAPVAERKRVEKYLVEIRKNPLAHVPVTVSKQPNGTYVATQGGKTATVAPGAKGTFTGVSNTTTTPPPAGHTSSSKK